MKKKENDWISAILIASFGFWFFGSIKKKVQKAGIGGLEKAYRNARALTFKNGKSFFIEEMIEVSKTNKKDLEYIIKNGIIEFRMFPQIQRPFFKLFKDEYITGEIIVGNFRIFVYRVSEKEYLLVRLFRKKSNETPESEKEIARNRIKQWIKENKENSKGLYFGSIL